MPIQFTGLYHVNFHNITPQYRLTSQVKNHVSSMAMLSFSEGTMGAINIPTFAEDADQIEFYFATNDTQDATASKIMTQLAKIETETEGYPASSKKVKQKQLMRSFMQKLVEEVRENGKLREVDADVELTQEVGDDLYKAINNINISRLSLRA
jgi:hypothetical protein